MGSKIMEVFYCDHPVCQTFSWLGNGPDWKMCEIVFGVHPKIRDKRHWDGLTTMVQIKFHFCRQHHWYKEKIYQLIAQELEFHRSNGKNGLVLSREANFREGLGCWITFHDCLTPGEAIKNFQMPYESFSRIYFYLLLSRTQ